MAGQYLDQLRGGSMSSACTLYFDSRWRRDASSTLYSAVFCINEIAQFPGIFEILASVTVGLFQTHDALIFCFPSDVTAVHTRWLCKDKYTIFKSLISACHCTVANELHHRLILYKVEQKTCH